MMNPRDAKRFRDSCTRATAGYMRAAGETYAALGAAWVQSWVSACDAAMETNAEKAQPKSWYRHPDKVDFFSPPARSQLPHFPNAPFFAFWQPAFAPAASNSSDNPWASLFALARMNPAFGLFASMQEKAGPTTYPYSPQGMAQFAGWAATLPLPGWWNFKPTAHPTVTWPMAYSMTVFGIPNAIAWPMAEANAAAMDAMQTAMTSINTAMTNRDTAVSTSNPPEETRRRDRDRRRVAQRAPDPRTTASTGTGPFEVALAMHSANTEAWKSWMKVIAASNPYRSPAA